MAANATKSISNVGGGGYMPPTMEERTMPGSMGGGGDYAFDEGQNPVQWFRSKRGAMDRVRSDLLLPTGPDS